MSAKIVSKILEKECLYAKESEGIYWISFVLLPATVELQKQ